MRAPLGVEQPRGGAVAIIQRFGGALNLNVHIHALVLDGVFARDRAGVVGFHPARRLTTLDVAEVLADVESRSRRLLNGGRRRSDDEDGGHAEHGEVDLGRTRRRHSPAWRRRRCRGSSRSGVTRALVSIVLDTRVRRSIGHWARVMLAGMGWTCMLGSSSRRGSAIGSSESVLRVETACRVRPARPDGRRPGARRAAAAVGRWDDTRRVRSGGVPRPAGRAGAAATRELDSLLWRARGPRRVAARRRAAPGVRSRPKQPFR
jgi:hypothetical protein